MFKKLFALSIGLLMLCGCAPKSTVAPILENISFTAEIDYGDDEFTADVKLMQDALNLVVTEPQEIKDLTLDITQNGVMAEFKGVTYTPDINSLPQGAIVQVLYEVLNDIRQNTAVCDEENCNISGKAEGYKYDFEFSPSGLPISLTVDGLDLEIDFKNVTVN